MKAMIFAAGLGTRLRPLTNDRPKALVEVNGKPMLGHLLHKLAGFGINEFVVNVHHFANSVIQYLNQPEFSDYTIQISDERDDLLETGGGLVKAVPLLKGSEPVMIHNVDIWTDLDYHKFLKYHVEHNAYVSLAMRDRKTSRYLWFNKDDELVGRENQRTGETNLIRECPSPKRLAFSGIHIVSQAFLADVKGEGAFSIIESYMQAASENKSILAYQHDTDFWFDLGKPEAIQQLTAFLA